MENKLHTIKVALAGNPNSGKSTLFNALTGLRQKTGNYPGVTVEKKTGVFFVTHPQTNQEVRVELLDLPGTYSLFPKSDDEKITCEILTQPSNNNFPDITIVVADASNLKRSMLLVAQIMDLGRPIVLVLNMTDIAVDLGYEIDEVKLENVLGVPVVKMNSRAQYGVEKLKVKLFSAASAVFDPQKNYAEFLIGENYFNGNHVSAGSAYAVIAEKALQFTEERTLSASQEQQIAFLKKFEAKDNLERFRRIQQIWSESVSFTSPKNKKTISQRLDDWFTHRILGPIIFLLILFIVFQSVFYLAEFPMAWIENFFVQSAKIFSEQLPEGKLKGFVCEGLIPGVSGIVVFVPQIALLFGFLAVLEDTGYMARVSMIMDRLMRGIGLNGRSVIPLVSGIACAVPAIMGTRTIANAKERLITILVTPLMSCSARLPVFTLLIAIMVPKNNSTMFLNQRGLWLMGLYLLGFVAAVAVALVLKYVIRTKEKSYFIMELPIYRLPQWKTVFIAMLIKVKVFLWDAGRVILTISIVLWALKSWGPSVTFKNAEHEINQQRVQLKKLERIDQENSFTGPIDLSKQADSIKQLLRKAEGNKLESSVIGIMGKFIEPAIAPLGFDWKIGISLITSFAAREVFVGTMATIYGSAEDDISLREKIIAQRDPASGKKIFTMATCVSLLLFYVFAMQCTSTLAVVARETKSWKWPFIQFLYMGTLAWTASYLAQLFFA